ncbi:MAG: PaaX family transcriptional regulator C-terminal domain-containing protein [Pseudomonadota bacterium]
MAQPPAARLILSDLVADLHAAGQLRTWSVIVSVFGDTALTRGSRMPASVLGQILAPLGIEPGAMRTALSRLAKDGWIESERSGRTSTYKLTAPALSESGVASQAIYGRTRPVTEASPRLMLWPENRDIPVDARLIPLRRGAGLWLGGEIPAALLSGALMAAEISDPIPDWVQAVVASPELADQIHELMTCFQPLRDLMQGSPTLLPVEAVAARVALTHAWRRIALRVPRVPNDFLPEHWPEPACRRFVLDLHKDLSALADPWLDAYLKGMPDEATPNVSQKLS